MKVLVEYKGKAMAEFNLPNWTSNGPIKLADMLRALNACVCGGSFLRVRHNGTELKMGDFDYAKELPKPDMSLLFHKINPNRIRQLIQDKQPQTTLQDGDTIEVLEVIDATMDYPE